METGTSNMACHLTRARISVSASVCLSVCLSVSVCVYVCMCVCCMCMYVCTYVGNEGGHEQHVDVLPLDGTRLASLTLALAEGIIVLSRQRLRGEMGALLECSLTGLLETSIGSKHLVL